ncbi:FAD-dependent oxidoreductase, partial [Halovivax sp.]|uniref:FAD-dependent oxidoreductase n=1 Tax=Halovivax sp. TaxID=1935978 RepID=UPI0025C1DE1C
MDQIDAGAGDGGTFPECDRIDVSVLVIGAGAAGARTAIELAERGVDDVLVIGKRSHGDAHTT